MSSTAPRPIALSTNASCSSLGMADSVDFSELKTESPGTVNLVMLGSPDHPLARRERVSISDLAGETVFLPKHDCSYKMMFEQWLVQEKIKTASMVEMNSIEAIKQCVAGGLGIAMMPDIAAAGEIAGATCPLTTQSAFDNQL